MLEIVQKPIPTCDNHPSDEVEVYCKQCNKGVCFDCSRIHHHNHDCEGIVKLSRRLRQEIPETCQQIRDGTLNKMKSELESIRWIQMDYKEKYNEEVSSLDNLQASCIKAVTKVFQTEKEKLSEKLKRHSNKLNAREQEIATSIENLTVHAQAHQDSQLTYGKFEIIEMDVQLKRMIDSYRPMDTEGSIHTSATESQTASSLMERIQICVKDVLNDILPSNTQDIYSKSFSRKDRRFGASNIEEFVVSQSSSAIYEDKYPSFITTEGIIVKVYSASITRLSVDCIVNASNERLMHGGGVAYAISNAAGYEFDRESRDYVRKYGPIPVGSCCTTGAGNLQYKCVIHTVGPRWQDYKNKRLCEKDLQQAVEVTFREAVKQGCDSIAAPAISSGIFGVPGDICAKQYYRAIVSFSSSQSTNPSLKEIHFVDKDQRMIDCITKEFKKLFASEAST